jgi:RNA polymerase sigma-70 factor (ECF subfamily)
MQESNLETLTSASDASHREDVADAELVERASQGDVLAFEGIMRRFNQRLFRLAVSIVNETSEAEDVLQESYVRAFYALGHYAGRGSLGAWLAQIVRNEAIDRVRARTALRKNVTLEAELSTQDEEASESILERHGAPVDDVNMNPLPAIENAEMKQVLEAAIADLPELFRGVFMLREIEGLSIEETAEYLGIPAATVKTRDHRARTLLRQQLGKRIDRTLPHAFQFLSTRCDNLVARVMERLRQ